eukprot:07558.XXX_447399_447521_1 [CDS] Oithona nana genome sequencing.
MLGPHILSQIEGFQTFAITLFKQDKSLSSVQQGIIHLCDM